MSTRPHHEMQPRTPNASSKQAAASVMDSLRIHEKMAALLPIAMRIAAIRKDCAAALPAMFEQCTVQRFESGVLILSVPNTAMAARLKQQLPKLQSALSQTGWQVSSIRLKVQVPEIIAKSLSSNKLSVPKRGVMALSALDAALEASPRNQALKSAIVKMVERHSKQD
ncbi:MAG: DciA family protein [Burkholderiaceae bacterium]|nr:DciA family protein [Burkholderiaceae bacterium]